MKRILIILLAPVILLLGLFLFSFGYTMITGKQLIEPSPEVAEPGAAPEEADKPPLDDPSLAEPAPRNPAIEIPPGLADDEVAPVLLKTGLWRVEDEVVGDPASFASLTVEHALRLYEPLAKASGDLETLRILLFAWLSYLPAEERAEFAEAVGAVHSTSFLGERGYRGDFVRLFYMQADDGDSIYAIAVRRYAAVLESDDVVDALIDFGAVLAEPDVDIWRIRVQDRMQSFDARTLLALRERIDLFFGLGDRKYLRAELAELAASKSTTD